ncbi:MAG: tail fiber domain-containing protein [Saprospiraceae bacterium]|nr:tail fiber domain-containing protein [Saprospiraceae bacterium]
MKRISAIVIFLLSSIYCFINAQNVGIGTTTPLEKLHLKGTLLIDKNSSSTASHLILNETQDDFSRLRFQNSSTSNYFLIAAKSQEDPSDARFNIFSNINGNLLSIRGNGNVGIGVGSPSAALQVNSRFGADLLRIQRDNSTKLRVYDNNAMVFGSNWGENPPSGVFRFNTPNMFIGFDGNHVPTERLEVDGKVRLDGLLMPVGHFKDYVMTSDADGEGYWAALPVDQVDDADASPSNELQTISKSGNTVTLSNGGGFFIDDDTDADASPSNELQNLALSGNTLSITSGNSVILPTGGGSGTLIQDPSGNELVDANRPSTYPQVIMDIQGTESFIFNRASGGSTLTFNNSNKNVAISGFLSPTFSGALDNVSIGNAVQATSITGERNVVLGVHTSSNYSGDDNIMIGNIAGAASTTRFRNVIIGPNSGQSITGNNNVCIGYQTGNGIGQQNVYIGELAGSNGNRNRGGAIGYLASTTASDQYVIGNINTVEIGGYEPWSNLSDGRFKINVKENVPGLEFIKALRPVTYNIDGEAAELFIRGSEDFNKLDLGYKKDLKKGKTKIETGFIAQEVESAAEILGYEFDGVKKPQNDNDPYALAYSTFVVPLVKAVQELSEKVEAQSLEILALKEELNLTKNLASKN